MKYEYGVEYETNGEKPDLPDDVMVHAFDFVLMQNYHREVEDINWSHVNKFRVIDVRTVEPFKPEVDDSSWHERGELPPVGTECLYVSSLGGSARVEITAHARMGICFFELGGSGESYVSKGQALRFHPIPTERDNLVNKATAILEKGVGDCEPDKYLAEQLIDAGWRPIKQQTEEEFISQCLKFMNLSCSDETYNSLYEMARYIHRAGCRFIEQGE